MPKMPKDRKGKKGGNRKLRIGNRKGGVSALKMSTKALVDVLLDSTKRRYHRLARQVLHKRGHKHMGVLKQKYAEVETQAA